MLLDPTLIVRFDDSSFEPVAALNEAGLGPVCAALGTSVHPVVWERALEVNYRSTSLWLKYAEMEMRGKFINHARNVWDRACTLLPRVDQLW